MLLQGTASRCLSLSRPLCGRLASLNYLPVSSRLPRLWVACSSAAGGSQQKKQPPSSSKGPAGQGKPGKKDASDDGKQRLSKVMAAAGVASRRACEELITSGVVKVNGQVVTSQVPVDPAKDKVEVNGKKLDLSTAGKQHFYFAVNKPKGYICSNAEVGGKEGKRVVDILQPWVDKWVEEHKKKKGLLPPRFFTVGRLDVASTGLIFVTNDGQWANQVIHPSANLTKEYLVLVDRAPTRTEVAQMMRGVEIDGAQVVPEEISTLEESVRLRVVVAEGKKHEGGPGASGVGGGRDRGRRRHQQPTAGAQGQAGGSSSADAASSGSERQVGGLQSGSAPKGTQQGAQQEAPTTSLSPSGIPRFGSARLVVEDEEGRRLWVWNVAAWRMSRAAAARDAAQAAAAARARVRRYRSGAPFRTRRLRRWDRRPLVMQPPVPPNAWAPGQWAGLGAARAAAEGAAAAWVARTEQPQPLLQAMQPVLLPPPGVAASSAGSSPPSSEGLQGGGTVAGESEAGSSGLVLDSSNSNKAGIGDTITGRGSSAVTKQGRRWGGVGVGRPGLGAHRRRAWVQRKQEQEEVQDEEQAEEEVGEKLERQSVSAESEQRGMEIQPLAEGDAAGSAAAPQAPSSRGSTGDADQTPKNTPGTAAEESRSDEAGLSTRGMQGEEAAKTDEQEAEGEEGRALAGGERTKAEAQAEAEVGESLLDPSFFDAKGRLLQGGALRAAQAALRARDARAQGKEERAAARQAGRAAAALAALEQDLVCKEDRDWQVRILVSSVGLEVLSLKRVRVGGYRMPRTLKLGQYAEMTPTEVRRVADLRAQQSASAKQPEQQVVPKPQMVRGVPLPDLADLR